MLSRALFAASKTSVLVQKRGVTSITDILQVGFYCIAPVAVSTLTLMMQIEIDDRAKLRARVEGAKKGSSDDKAEALEMAVRSNALGRRRAVTELLASIPDADRFDLSCGKFQPVRTALISSCFSGDKALAAAILSKSKQPCICITSAFGKDSPLKCVSNGQSRV